MILPTTDGDMLGYDPTAYFEDRKSLFQKEIRLVWVATASGLEYIEAMIPALDKAAQKLTEESTKEALPCMLSVTNRCRHQRPT